jgi:hypothetical protein
MTDAPRPRPPPAQPRRTPARAQGHDRHTPPQTAGCGRSRPDWATPGVEVTASGGPAHYEIRIEGILDSRWAAWFGDLHIEKEDTQTVISGSLADQPALHGLLTKIRDLGLCLISVRRLDAD